MGFKRTIKNIFAKYKIYKMQKKYQSILEKVKKRKKKKVVFLIAFIQEWNKFQNIYFEFKDGKIIKAEAGDKTKELNEILDTDEGSRYIGEFAIGVNPYILSPMKDILFDEKICGSIHFTPGNCYDEAPNGNTSAIHWDLVWIQRPEYGGGEIYFDDVLIRKDGRFIIPELECLNPENLK